MNSNSTAKEQEEKIHKFSELVIDNDENGKDEVEELIHPDFIRAMDALAELQKEGCLYEETMKEINDLWDKHVQIRDQENNEKEPA